MKKTFTQFFLFAIFCIASISLNAQTYNGGVWYSLYDMSEKTKSTNDGGNIVSYSVFTPSTGAFSFETKMTGVVKPDSYELTVDGVTVSVGKGQNSYIGKEATVNANASSLTVAYKYKFYNATRTVYVKNAKLPLAQHILLNEGQNSKSFGNVTIDGQSAAQTVTLRSFLTAGNITIKSDNNAFRINSAANLSGHTFAVGANACASANGSGAAGGSNLGDINQYAFNIYFCPSEATSYNATITITDGVSTATIAVSGTGVKKDQTIIWNDKYNEKKLSVGQQVTDLATALGGAVTYSTNNDSVIAIINEGAGFKALAAGEATIYATQAGDDKWNTVTDSVVLTVMEKQVQYIHWADNLTRLKLGVDSAVVLTATAQVMVGEDLVELPERTALITYQTADSSVIVISGDTLLVMGEGETTVTATLPGDEIFEAAAITMPVRVRVPSTTCETYVLEAIDEFSHEYSVVWQERIYEPAEFTGPGHVLTFEARKEASTAVGNIEIQQFVNGSWVKIDEANPGTDWREYYYVLDRNATKIRFYNGYGSYKRYFKNVLVTQATYLETTTPAINVTQAFGNSVEETIAIQYSNLPDEVVITHTSAETQLSDNQINCECGMFGEKLITLTATPTLPGTILDTITIANATTGFSLTIPVVINTQRYNQVVEWNDSIETIYATDVVAPFTATAINEITYSTSDSAIAYVDELNQLVIQAAGVVTITAHAAESDFYAAAQLSKTITILHAEQSIEWAFVSKTIEIGDSINLYTDINTAVATSGLEVAYEYSTDWANYVTFDEITGTIVAIAEGVIYITAYQDGDHIYAPAEDVVAMLTVVAEGTATGMENTPMQNVVTKQIVNGQLVIIRNGQTYDIQGRMVR